MSSTPEQHPAPAPATPGIKAMAAIAPGVSLDPWELLESLPCYIYQLQRDPAGVFHYTYVGTAVEEMFGVTAAEVHADADTLLGMIHPDDIGRVIDSSLESVARLAVWRCEFRMQLPDGRLIWLEAIDTPKQLPDGTMVWTGYGIDITRRKQLEAALVQSESRFRSFVENLDDIIYTIDAAGVITYVSPNWTRKQGFPVGELLGRTFEPFVHPEDHEACLAFLRQAMTADKPLSLEFRLRHKDGYWCWSSSTLSAVRDAEGKVLYGLGVTHDISKRKRSEDRIRFLAHHDSLTGLPNRESLFSKLEDALHQLDPATGSLVLMFLDLDYFKPVNDQHGHATGDRLLQAVAKRIREVLRGSDFVSRVGGDEFIVLLPSVKNPDDAVRIAEKLREALMQPFAIDDLTLHIGCSIGLALAPRDGTSGTELARKADEAMYLAKSRGRNRCVVWGI